ncbi:MAG: prepilin peptidase [Planctomycetaceae bacterium]|nr:prepilin peptidase [Planctomycetaceae bacterium]
MAVLLGIYLIAIPGIDAILEQFRQPDYRARLQEEMTVAESIQVRTTEVVVSACFIVLGATIGSYLNVVVYRVPRVISLVHQRSACPECATPIDGRDNIPILGWLLLKGACRNCRLPIAARYPLVEGVAGGIFMLLYFLELISGGANLPVRPPLTATPGWCGLSFTSNGTSSASICSIACCCSRC